MDHRIPRKSTRPSQPPPAALVALVVSAAAAAVDAKDGTRNAIPEVQHEKNNQSNVCYVFFY